MLRNLAFVVILVGTLSSCHRHSPLVGDHPAELVGTWQLQIRSSCSNYGLKADSLVLYANGTFDQHVTLNDGKQFDVAGQHWQYNSADTGGRIALDKRLDFFAPEHFGKRVGEGVGTFEELILEIKSKPVIVLNPDSDCVYVMK